MSKTYDKRIALDDVSLQVRPGELLALLGPNGAGKSTAIALFLGLIEPDKGTVRLVGGAPTDLDCRRRMGVMMQEVEVARTLRVRELIALISSYYPHPLGVEPTLELTRTASLADSPVQEPFRGSEAAGSICNGCLRPPRAAVPRTGHCGARHVQAREAMWATIRALLASGCSIVLTTHYLEEAEALADRVIVLAKGRVLASGSVDEMRALVARRQINCESSLSAEEIRGWPGVAEVLRDEQGLHVVATDAEEVVRRLLAADSELRKLEVRLAGLSEAFVHLTKEAA